MNDKEIHTMKYFIGIDVGTSSVKSLLMGENGSVLGVAQREYDISKPYSSWAEQDIESLWRATAETLRELTSKYPCEIAGIGYSGQMHGLVSLDTHNKPVRPAIIWADQRSGDSIAWINSRVPDYRDITFNSLSTGFLLASLIWVRDNEPENYEKISHVMLPKDYIRFRMTGELGTEVSDASATAAFDVAKREWAWDMLAKLNLPREIFVPCRDSSDIAGKVTRACADETGLPEGVPIVYGGGDTLVQTVGNGVTDSLISNIGTASQLLCPINSPLHDSEFRTNTFCHVANSQWLIMGANLTGGVALKWLRGILGLDSYDEMTKLALEAGPGANGVIFLPYLNGERTPWNDPKARGIFFGLGLEHGRKDLIRATMEGIIFAQRESLEIFRGMGLKFDRVVVSGGGARSQAFREIIASVLNCEVVTNKVNEQGCIGAAILSAVGTGFFANINEACKQVVKFNDAVTSPNSEISKLYDDIFINKFHKLYPNNKDLFIQ